MANIRMSRINSEFQKAIMDIISNRLNNPNLDGLIISIIDVDTTNDLSLAKVAVSVLSTNEVKSLVVAELNKAKNFIRHQLMHMVRLKTYPELEFYVDNSYEEGKKLTELIEKVSRSDNNA